MSQAFESETRLIAPVPRVAVQAFCETEAVVRAIEAAASDRRMQKAQATICMGGAAAAVAAFKEQPTPNLILLESGHDRNGLLVHLDSLAEVCDPGTKVVVIGHVNDVLLYRELTRRGVSDYLIAPVAAPSAVPVFCTRSNVTAAS
jgi:pilus assembly protein CpaE